MIITILNLTESFILLLIVPVSFRCLNWRGIVLYRSVQGSTSGQWTMGGVWI